MPFRFPFPFGPRDARSLDSLRFVVLDTELTSLDKRANRVLSFGAIAMTGSRILLGEQIYRVVNPGVEVPAAGVLIHGLRPSDVSSAAAPAEVLSELHTFVGDAVIVGHFVAIDLHALRKEWKACGLPLHNPAICTARAHSWILRHQPWSDDLAHHLDNLDLASLAKYYNLEASHLHHALGDAFVTACVWQKMLSPLQRSGIITLGDLLRIARA